MLSVSDATLIPMQFAQTRLVSRIQKARYRFDDVEALSFSTDAILTILNCTVAKSVANNN